MGVERMVITHALNIAGSSLTLDEQGALVEKGAYIEHCFSHTMPLLGRIDPMVMTQAIQAVGARRCVLSTDLGQAFNPSPWDGMRMAIATFLKCGLKEEELIWLVRENPSHLLKP